MIDMTRTFKIGDSFRHADGKTFSIPTNWRKSTLSFLRGRGAYLYVSPEPTALQRLGDFQAIMQDDVQVGITEEVVDKTQGEIDAELDVAQTNAIASRYQIKRALHELGQLDDAKSAYNAIVDPLLKLEWSDNDVLRRNGPLALDMQTRFSKTDQKMDDLFALAQTY